MAGNLSGIQLPEPSDVSLGSLAFTVFAGEGKQNSFIRSVIEKDCGFFAFEVHNFVHFRPLKISEGNL